MKLRGRNVLTDLVPSERRRDGPQPPGPRGIRSGECPSAVMLKIIEVDFIAAILLQPFNGEQLGEFLGYILPHELADRSKFIERNAFLNGNDDLDPGST